MTRIDHPVKMGFIERLRLLGRKWKRARGVLHGLGVLYLRISTGKQDLDNQKLEILSFASKHKLDVNEFMKVEISTRKTTKQRRIDELLERLLSICREILKDPIKAKELLPEYWEKYKAV